MIDILLGDSSGMYISEIPSKLVKFLLAAGNGACCASCCTKMNDEVLYQLCHILVRHNALRSDFVAQPWS
jgi:hypothetical protein